MKRFAIIGAGPAGYKTALELKKYESNSKIYLFEKNRVGGACLHYGCIPSKQLQYIENEHEYLKKLKKNKTLLEKALLSNLKESNIDFINEEASYNYNPEENEFIVKTNSKEFKADYLILALGSKPRRLHHISTKKIIDSDIFFSEEYLSKGFSGSYCFIGGGYIAVEIASMLAKLGKKVRILEKEAQILSFLDAELRNKMEANLKNQGIKIETNLEEIDLESIEEETIFSAIGREAVQAKLDENLKSQIDKKLFMLGDMQNSMPLAHFAYAEAKELAAKIYAKEPKDINLNLVPQVIFTNPEFAHIGPFLEKAKENDDIQIIEKSWASNAKARITGNERGYLRLLIEKSSRKIVSVSLIGSGATDLISVMIPPVNLGLSLNELEDMIFPHPTLAEIFID